MKRGVDFTAISVVTLCHDGKGKYLLGQRSDKCRDEHFRWDLIGSGGLEFGEKIEDGLRREVKEETGAEVKSAKYLGYREVMREENSQLLHWIAFDFKVEVNPKQVNNPEPEKCLEMNWFGIDEFPEPMHSQWPIFFEKYKDKL